jgi:hypothetical protein
MKRSTQLVVDLHTHGESSILSLTPVWRVPYT